MRDSHFPTFAGICSLVVATQPHLTSAAIRPPAVPLIVHDSFVSVWQPADNLTDSFPMFWSGPVLGMVGLMTVDGNSCRWLGVDTYSSGAKIVACQQLGLPLVMPTQTYYSFQFSGAQLNVTFSTPVLGSDLPTWIDNPVTYLTLSTASTDGAAHAVRLYFEHTAELTVADVADTVQWQRDAPVSIPDAFLLRFGSEAQNVLGSSGDAMRISWGFQYLAVPFGDHDTQSSVGDNTILAPAFLAGQPLPADDTNQPRACNNGWPVLAAAWDLGVLQPAADSVSVFSVITFDEIAVMNYYGSPLAPAWAHGGTRTIADVISTAISNYTSMMSAMTAFDQQLWEELVAAGGQQYAELTSLAYRQVYGSIVYSGVPSNLTGPCASSDYVPTDIDTAVEKSSIDNYWASNTYWAFMEEMSSDGDVSTVDVLYPAAPGVLYFSAKLMATLMKPVMAYAANCTSYPYEKAFAPHDLGTWPIANRAWNNQEDMPVEESGNLLILAGVIYNVTGNTGFIESWQWPLFEQWAQFVNTSLPNPPPQLCTDDFEGPAPNNTNLVIKGITALNAWADLLEAANASNPLAQEYRTSAASFVSYWLQNAMDASTSGNYTQPHFNREYQLPAGSSFSLKYNTIFGYFLGYVDSPSWFPSSMMETEFAFYFSNSSFRNSSAIATAYGVPLDDRNPFTLVEYMADILAVAGVVDASKGTNYQPMLTQQLYNFANETPQRVALTDWYNVFSAARWGFAARATVGDLFGLVMMKNRLFGSGL